MRSGMQIAFLGYGHTQTRLINVFEELGHNVTAIAERIDDLSIFDLVVSFGYRYILRQSVLDTVRRPVLNLHISYLPYNRGAHPNFWSWVEGTPSGVTIHEIDTGIDTGPIIAQALLEDVSCKLTFRETYAILIGQIEQLFVDNANAILSGQYIATAQIGVGTYHASKDLPGWMQSWDMCIADAMIEHQRHV